MRRPEVRSLTLDRGKLRLRKKIRKLSLAHAQRSSALCV